MKCAARWGDDTFSSTQHRLGFDPRGCTFIPRSPSYTQSSAQEAVPSGLSFSRNHFLKEKKRGDDFLILILRNKGILEALSSMFS